MMDGARLVANYKTMPMQTLIDNTLLATAAFSLSKSSWESVTGDFQITRVRGSPPRRPPPPAPPPSRNKEKGYRHRMKIAR